MKQTAIVVAPGRGTYNRAELGYLARHHAGHPLLVEFDAYRVAQGQEPLTALDGADRFDGRRHVTGDNASGLIYACSLLDFLAIDRDRFDIVGVTGNSMGWYTALACGGAVPALDGLRIVNTMGRLMHEKAPGGQLVYPVADEDWRPDASQRARVLDTVATLARQNAIALSIDLGGLLVIAGEEAGLAAFEAAMPRVQDRFPMRLPHHAAFHTALMSAVAAEGRAALGADLFGQPTHAMIDGRGAIWRPRATDTRALHGYTLGHQVTETYDLAAALRVAARELMPDVFIVLGPGPTLGGSVGQALVACGWRGWATKADMQAGARVISMGMEAQRALAV